MDYIAENIRQIRAQMEEARARRAEITEKLKPWFPVLLPDWEVR